MSRRRELKEFFKIQLIQDVRKDIDTYLSEKGIEFFEGETNYTDEQRFLHTYNIDINEISPKTRILSNILKNIKQPNPTKISNINNNNKFPIYQFLTKLQEPAENHFKEASEGYSVVEYLVLNHDPDYPCKENNFEEEVWYEGGEIYLDVKRTAIQNLREAFVNRRIVKKDHNGYNLEDINKIITSDRYEYLNNLAKSFNKNPKSKEIIDFIKQLPGNTWWDGTIILDCDNHKEFESLRKKYSQ